MSYLAEEPRIETFCNTLFTVIDRH